MLTIKVGDYGELLSDDAVRALELMEEPAAPSLELCQLFVHAITDSEVTDTIRLRILVDTQDMLLLLDFGSTYNFINTTFVDHIGATTAPIPLVGVKLANG